MAIEMLIWVGLWLAFTGGGLAAALWNRHDARRDLGGLDPDIQNGRRMYGEGWVRLETIRAAVQGIGFSLGVMAILGIRGPTVQLLVLMAALIALNTVMDYRQRRRMNRALGIRH